MLENFCPPHVPDRVFLTILCTESTYDSQGCYKAVVRFKTDSEDLYLVLRLFYKHIYTSQKKIKTLAKPKLQPLTH